MTGTLLAAEGTTVGNPATNIASKYIASSPCGIRRPTPSAA